MKVFGKNDRVKSKKINAAYFITRTLINNNKLGYCENQFMSS